MRGEKGITPGVLLAGIPNTFPVLTFSIRLAFDVVGIVLGVYVYRKG